jgi:hypothetical protein
MYVYRNRDLEFSYKQGSAITPWVRMFFYFF